tara:strand:+ start:62 stop:1195 length:1134 start_codon:yes stop_codon:yes gene_type:complete
MSSINVDTIRSREGGPPTLSKGVVVSAAATFSSDVSIGGTLTYEDVTNVDAVGLITARSGIELGAAGIGGTIRANGDTTLAGVVTATSFVGNLTGNPTGSAAGLTAIPGGQITGALAAVDGSALTGMANTANVSTSGLYVVGVATVGTGLTLPDNVQARFGNAGDLKIYHSGSNSFIDDSSGTGALQILSNEFYVANAANTQTMLRADEGAAVKLYFAGSEKLKTTASGTITTGISTVTVGTDLDGYKVEEGSYDTDVLNGEFDFELENGHVQTHTGSTGGTYFPDFRVSSSQSLDSVMDVGDVISCTLIVSASNASHYCTTGIKIDNSTSNITLEWIGSSAPSAGKGAGFDIYSFTIQKTAATPAYLIIGNATDAG